MITKKAAENAAMIKPQIDDDKAPANYYGALRDEQPRHRSWHAGIPDNPMMAAFGCKGFGVENPKDIRGAFDEL